MWNVSEHHRRRVRLSVGNLASDAAAGAGPAEAEPVRWWDFVVRPVSYRSIIYSVYTVDWTDCRITIINIWLISNHNWTINKFIAVKSN